MKVPPILILDESQSMLEILKTIEKKEHALARYASAEAERIGTMVKYLEEFGVVGVPADELAAFVRRASAAASSAEVLQAGVESNRDAVLGHMGVDALSRLVPLPHGACCRVRAGGQGVVRQEGDHFFHGLARLEEADIVAASQVIGRVRYQVTKGAEHQQLESVEDGLGLELVEPRGPRTTAANPLVALITGYGMLRFDRCGKMERALARFALTAWDCGAPSGNQFRMMYVAPERSFVHDSGIVRA